MRVCWRRMFTCLCMCLWICKWMCMWVTLQLILYGKRYVRVAHIELCVSESISAQRQPNKRGTHERLILDLKAYNVVYHSLVRWNIFILPTRRYILNNGLKIKLYALKSYETTSLCWLKSILFNAVDKFIILIPIWTPQNRNTWWVWTKCFHLFSFFFA